MKTSVSEIVFDGKAPYLPFLQKVFIFLAIVPPVGIYFFPDDFRNIGTYGWYLLFSLLFLRPLGDIFPDIRFFRALLPLRKEGGILTASLVLSHVWGYFLSNDIPFFSSIFDAYIWDPTHHFFWGALGAIISFLLLITSNVLSLRILKVWWKRLHRLVYPFFFVGLIHIILIRYFREGAFFSHDVLETVIPAVVLLIVWILSFQKFQINFFRTISD